MRKALLLAVVALGLTGCDSGEASTSPMASPLQELQGRWTSPFFSNLAGSTGCKTIYVTFGADAAYLHHATKGTVKPWLKLKSATVKNDRVRLHVVTDEKKPMFVYLERYGQRLEMAELRDENDKMSMKEALEQLPPQLRASMAKLVDGVVDMMDQMFRMEQCPTQQ